MTFLEFFDRKKRESLRHLKILNNMFKKNQMECKAFLDDDKPYLYLTVKKPHLSFDGVRIYQIGNSIAFRVQKEETTEPYGKAYAIEVEDIYSDYMSENIKEEEAGKKVIEEIIRGLNKFFLETEKAERDLENQYNNPGIILKAGGTDYSSLIFNKS